MVPFTYVFNKVTALFAWFGLSSDIALIPYPLWKITAASANALEGTVKMSNRWRLPKATLN